jgi:dipeptidyl aminopeptidase/acylaminoacyl peptidase
MGLLLMAVLTAAGVAQKKHALTAEDMIEMKRLDHVSVSPDGQWIAYNVRQYRIASNTYASNVFLTSIDGKTTRQLTYSAYRDMRPEWSPDGRSLAFVSNRTGSFQIYLMSVDGGEPRRLTDLSTPVNFGNGLVWSPDGRMLAFSADVYPDCADDACNKDREQARESHPVKARAFEQLPYRVWDSWKDGKRSQVLLLEIETGRITDLIEGDFDVPPIDLGGKHDYAFSPDSKSLLLTMHEEPGVAWSTNNDVFLMPVGGGKLKKISASHGADNHGTFSPDGKHIVFRSMKRPGYEADKTDLLLYDVATGHTKNLTEKLDRSVAHYVWAPDGAALYFDCDEAGYHSVYRVELAGEGPHKLTSGTYDKLVGVTKDRLVTRRQSLNSPEDLYVMALNGHNPQPLTALNKDRLANIEMEKAEEFWFDGAANVRVHGFLIRPPGFHAKKKYPMVYLIHGGPQGAWGDDWHYRWNPQLFAAPGFVVVMVNPRGSTGYGQRFTDDINRDWGGKVYEDLMKGVDFVLQKYPFIDKDRIGAAGGSYGGYMVNWMNGHTDRFKCFVSHSGIMNEFNMYGVTEELWFEEWEMGGPYWEDKNRELYEKWSPYAYAQNFKTPTLVIHGELDFRVPVSEGMHLFTVLQRKGIPSRFLYYPDEGHWILKPQNSKLWYEEVHNWLEHWLIPYEK